MSVHGDRGMWGKTWFSFQFWTLSWSFPFISASSILPELAFFLITTLQTWNRLPWGGGGPPVQTPPVILLSFAPFIPFAPVLPLCLPHVFLSVSLLSPRRWCFSVWGFLLKLVPVSFHVHLWQQPVFSQVGKKPNPKIYGRKMWNEWERGRKKRKNQWLIWCMCVCWFLLWLSGCQGNNCESRRTVKIHSLIDFYHMSF